MKITSLDIRKQEFNRSFRGYDMDEVDSFLQVVATQWQELIDELRRSGEKLQEQQLKLDHYMKVEEALEEALQTARSSARITIENAEKKARHTLEVAENRIVELQKAADSERLQMKRDTAKYAVRQQEIVAKLRAFLMSEMEMLGHFDPDNIRPSLAASNTRKEIELVRDELAHAEKSLKTREETSPEDLAADISTSTPAIPLVHPSAAKSSPTLSSPSQLAPSAPAIPLVLPSEPTADLSLENPTETDEPEAEGESGVELGANAGSRSSWEQLEEEAFLEAEARNTKRMSERADAASQRASSATEEKKLDDAHASQGTGDIALDEDEPENQRSDAGTQEEAPNEAPDVHDVADIEASEEEPEDHDPVGKAADSDASHADKPSSDSETETSTDKEDTSEAMPSWRITQAFDVADDGETEEEIRKIHQILKDLDED